MSALTHPSMTAFGKPRESVAPEEWKRFIGFCSRRMNTATDLSELDILDGMRAAALAARDDAEMRGMK